MPDFPRPYRMEGTEDDFTLHTTSEIGVKKLEAPPVEIAVGSGLDLRTTVTAFTSPKIDSVIALEIVTPKSIGAILTSIGLVVT